MNDKYGLMNPLNKKGIEIMGNDKMIMFFYVFFLRCHTSSLWIHQTINKFNDIDFYF